MSTWVVCYDISDDALRERAAQLLGRWGDRVQRSVFEVALPGESERATLAAELSRVLGRDADVRFYRLCETCRKDSHALDGAPVARFPTAIIL